MESELTQITQCVQQGNYVGHNLTPSDGYIADGYKNYSDKIQLKYHDMSAAYLTSGELEAHDGPMHSHLAWDCSVAFKPTIQVSGSGKGGFQKDVLELIGIILHRRMVIIKNIDLFRQILEMELNIMQLTQNHSYPGP